VFFLAKEVLFLFLGGFQLDSELLQILGFFVAFPLGVYWLRSGRVDCEGWDLFSYLNGITGKDSRYAKRRKSRKASD